MKTGLAVLLTLAGVAAPAVARAEFKIAVRSHVMLQGLNLGHAREMAISETENELNGYAKDGWHLSGVSAVPEGSGLFTLVFVLERGGATAMVAAPALGGAPTPAPAAAEPPISAASGDCVIHALKKDIKATFGRDTEVTLVTGATLRGRLLRDDDGVLVLQTSDGISRINEVQVKEVAQN